MAAIKNVGEVTDAVASMFRYAYYRRRDLSGTNRVWHCEIFRQSHITHNVENGPIPEAV